MTIDQLAAKVNAPSVTALESKLSEFGLTVDEVASSTQYQDDLRSEFASGLAVSTSAISTTSTASKAPQSKSGAVTTTKKGGAVSKKAQKLEMSQAKTAQKASAIQVLQAESAESAVISAREFFDSQEELETVLSEAMADRLLNMDSAIASKTIAMMEESGGAHRIDFGGIARTAVAEALKGLPGYEAV
jgi:hypothetical protein